MKTARYRYLIAVIIIVVIGLGWTVINRLQEKDSASGKRKEAGAAPVEAVQVQQGLIVLKRTFSGTLEATSKFVIAPKVSGRIERLSVDLADIVKRGQVVAELDNDEYVQAVAQAKADLAVSRANLAEAKSALKISTRDLERIETLRSRGVASESQLDTAKAEQLAKQVQLEVAEAQVTRAEAVLESANIRLGYTKIKTDWPPDSGQRVVAERYVDQGETVSANTPLLLIVELNPITGVIYVTEKDYARVHPDQSVTLTTDTFPEDVFTGQINRISPVFRETTRQARIELRIDNPQQRLKPGMFIRAEVELDRVADATIVPDKSLTTRNDETGVFVINEEGMTVTWLPVKVGIREGNRVQVKGQGLSGRVVTLGQQLLDDGSPITIPDDMETPRSSGTSADRK
ncbi:MAG: efflux RND transporter periplasmic adaptor subunit [Nitrospiraceae bacterium]|nr:MAG: efflux RND transporter periplasmic adaptor subunit [Nitrospiraceae bacterium]